MYREDQDGDPEAHNHHPPVYLVWSTKQDKVYYFLNLFPLPSSVLSVPFCFLQPLFSQFLLYVVSLPFLSASAFLSFLFLPHPTMPLPVCNLLSSTSSHFPLTLPLSFLPLFYILLPVTLLCNFVLLFPLFYIFYIIWGFLTNSFCITFILNLVRFTTTIITTTTISHFDLFI